MNIRESYLNGIRPADLKIVDVHAHIGNSAGCHMPLESSDEGIQRMESLGISAMCASHLTAIGGDVSVGNKELFDMCDQYPGKVYGKVFYDPRCPEISLEDIEKYRNHHAFTGVKIHPRESFTYLSDDSYRPLWEYAEKNKLIVTCHTWESEPMNTPELFFDICSKYTSMKVILAHCGGTYAGYEICYRLVKEFPNVYIDMNGFIYSCQWIEQAVERFNGVDRIVFGTDQFFNDPRTSIGRVVLSTLSDDEKRRILYYNFALICDKFEL